MKQKQKNILLIAGMLLVMLVSIFVYSFYTQKQIYQESTANLRESPLKRHESPRGCVDRLFCGMV